MTVLETPVRAYPRSLRSSDAGSGFGEAAQMLEKQLSLLDFESSISATWQRNERVRLLLDGIYQLSAKGSEAQALQCLLASLESALSAGDVDSADATLRLLDVARVGPSVLLAALTITSYAKDDLRERPSFMSRAETELRASVGEQRTQNLLATRR
jgi:hypothetical protein